MSSDILLPCISEKLAFDSCFWSLIIVGENIVVSDALPNHRSDCTINDITSLDGHY